MNFLKRIFGTKSPSKIEIPVNENELTVLEQQICNELHYPYEDALLLKRLTGSEINKFTFEHTESEVEPPNYISANFRNKKPNFDTILEIQETLSKNGKFLFINELSNPKDLVIANDTNDPYKIMQYAETNAINYELDNTAVISKIKEWDTRFGIKFIGIGYDFLILKIINTTNIDFEELANEINEFCPDAEDIDSIFEDLENSLIKLWWD